MPNPSNKPLTQSNLPHAENAAEQALQLLPRSAWNDQIKFFRALFKAKQALDGAERGS